MYISMLYYLYKKILRIILNYLRSCIISLKSLVFIDYYPPASQYIAVSLELRSFLTSLGFQAASKGQFSRSGATIAKCLQCSGHPHDDCLHEAGLID